MGTDHIEFDGSNWVPFNPLERPAEGPFRKDIQVANFGLFRILRTEIWTSVCYNLKWRIVWGTKVPPQHDNAIHETKKSTTAFMRQKFIWQFKWKLMKGNITSEYYRQEMDEFKYWLTLNYPGIQIPLDNLPTHLWWAILIGGIILQLLVTLLVGALSKFHVGTPSQAAWLLVWVYGSGTLRWLWLINEGIYKAPCLSVMKWISFWIIVILEFLLALTICCGITELLVELFGALCGQEFVLAPRIWILIGILVILVFVIAATVIIHLRRIVGMPRCF
jgi:hypothetical protein